MTSVRSLLRRVVIVLLMMVAPIWLLPGSLSPAAAEAASDPSHQLLVMLRLPLEHYNPSAGYGGSYGGGDGRGARRRLAEKLAAANGLRLVDDWPMPMIGLDCYIMEVPPDESVADAVTALSRDPGIAWAEPMQTYRTQGGAGGGPIQGGMPAIGDDPLYRVQPDAKEWQLDALHTLATGHNIRIAIVDSTIESHHPDLAGQVMLSEDFVIGRPSGAEVHGTGVAGIIAALAGNGQGIVGVAPRARLMGLRACWQQSPAITLCDSLSLAKALYFAVEHKADIINMSLSGPNDPLLAQLIDLAQSRGITVVGAVDPAQGDGGFPASHAGVIAVVDEGGPPGAAGGTAIFGAPGRDIPTTQPGGNWFFVNGSSYAAAHVSGLFALLRERSPGAHTASSLITVQGSDAIDPCASLLRLSKLSLAHTAKTETCGAVHAMVLQARP